MFEERRCQCYDSAVKLSRMRPHMTLRIAINGFGRIGRNVLRALHESGRTDIEIVAINDLSTTENLAHLIKYDSVHGRFGGQVSHTENSLDIGRGKIQVTAERNLEDQDWADNGVDIVMECTGIFTARDAAAKHLSAGAKRVLISAPGANADKTIVYGVNHDVLGKDDIVVSNGSCTTNALAPKAIGLVLPELEGKLDGKAIRVPTPNVSVVDLTGNLAKRSNKDSINAAMHAAAEGPLKNVLQVIDDSVVSIDLNHDPHSSSLVTGDTVMVTDNFARVLSWYDNEWGFSNRMLDTAAVMGKFI